jgi:hypothetical protein
MTSGLYSGKRFSGITNTLYLLSNIICCTPGLLGQLNNIELGLDSAYAYECNTALSALVKLNHHIIISTKHLPLLTTKWLTNRQTSSMRHTVLLISFVLDECFRKGIHEC